MPDGLPQNDLGVGEITRMWIKLDFSNTPYWVFAVMGLVMAWPYLVMGGVFIGVIGLCCKAAWQWTLFGFALVLLMLPAVALGVVQLW